MLIYIFSLVVGTFWAVVVLLFSLLRFFKFRKQEKSEQECNSTDTVHYTYPPELFQRPFAHHKFVFLPRGVRLHYVECGEADNGKPVMLLLHGFPEFWYSWRHQLVHFSSRYRVIALDMLGYGLSDKPQPMCFYEQRLLIDDIRQFLEQIAVSKCHLVGHDWGGILAWQLATLYPDLLETLVVMNAPHVLIFPRAFTLKQFLRSWYSFFFQIPFLPEYLLSRGSCKTIVDIVTSPPYGIRLAHVSEKEKLAFRANFMIPGAVRAAVNYYRAMYRYSNRALRLDRIQPTVSSKLPCLLIWGEKDMCLEKCCAEATAKLVPHLQVSYIAAASHFVQQDVPDLVNAIMDKFLHDAKKSSTRRDTS